MTGHSHSNANGKNVKSAPQEQEEFTDKLSRLAAEGGRKIEEQVREKPQQSLLTALMAGLALGFLFRGRK